MSKIRVYDLARELGLTNKELMDLLEREGHGVKSHASSLADDLAALVRDMVFAERKAKAAPAPAAPEAPAAEAAAAAKPPAKPPAKPAAEAAKQPPKELHFKVPVTVRELAEAICRKPNELIGELMMMNVFATINNLVEIDVIEKICQRHGITFIRERRGAQAKPRRELAAAEAEAEAEAENTVPRPPVVAFLGHVDHGKTSLQDAIRKTNVAGGEAGGITQSIGASVVEWNGQQITMIDTPGHEAFTAMRARGASATDIVILVVAADDGLMPQTIEAIQHAQAAKVPMLVAMNKMDLPGANPDHVKLGMQQQGVTCEEWGGDVGIVPVSAITRQGIEDLLERILLEAEMLELKGNPDIPAKGLVIEAQLETGMGPTANLLVRNGTLHVGDVIVCGKCFGRIKAMIDYHGKRVKQAGPSTPVKVMGLSGVPDAGDLIEVYADEKEARAIAEQRIAEARQTLNVSRAATTVEELFSKMQETTRTELKVILKTDVRGSLEAIQGSFAKIKSAKITLNLIAGNVGEITENDVLLASTSKATILGFNVRAMPGVQALARREKVEIRLYGIIYEMLDDVEAILLGRLAPESRETRVGKAEIIQVIVLSKGAGKICGCRVSEGAVRVGANAIVTRGQDVIYKGRIASLRRFKEDAKEVKSGLECGIRLDNFEDFEVGDAIEVFTVEKVAATL